MRDTYHRARGGVRITEDCPSVVRSMLGHCAGCLRDSPPAPCAVCEGRGWWGGGLTIRLRCLPTPTRAIEVAHAHRIPAAFPVEGPDEPGADLGGFGFLRNGGERKQRGGGDFDRENFVTPPILVQGPSDTGRENLSDDGHSQANEHD